MRQSFHRQVQYEMQHLYEERAKDGRYDIGEMMNYPESPPPPPPVAKHPPPLPPPPELSPLPPPPKLPPSPEMPGSVTESEMLDLVNVLATDLEYESNENVAKEEQPVHVSAPHCATRSRRLRKRRRCAGPAVVPAAAGAGAAGGEPVL